MGDGDAPDSLFPEKLKKFIIKYGDELLKPCDSTKELLRKLDRFEHVLLHTPQEYKKLVEMLLQPYKEALMSNEFIRHSELDVRVSAASCIGEIISITTPDEPYGDDHMKEFFEVVNSAFERLSCMSGRVYSKAVSILQTMSTAQSCVIMLDLELYATVHRMFHRFLDGIRTSHPNEVFSSMEKIMTIIIRNTKDNDEFLLLLVKILLSSLKIENQKASPVSFQLAENTFKNCSDDLKTYRLEAIGFLDVPIDDYAGVVVSFFEDAIQMENMEFKDTLADVSCSGDVGLGVEAGICDLTAGDEIQNYKNDESCNEDHEIVSQISVDPDKSGKSIDMQHEQPEEIQFERKRNRRPNSLKTAEEGYDPFWMYVDWDSEEKYPGKKDKISKDPPPKPVGEHTGSSISLKSCNMKNCDRNKEVPAHNTLQPTSTSEGVILASDDKTRDIAIMNHSGKGQGSSTEVVPEDLKEDGMTSASQCIPICSKEEDLSKGVCEQNPKDIVSHLRFGPFFI